MPLVPATPPAPTPEFESLTPAPGEHGLDALARVGDSVAQELAVTPKKKLPRQLAGLIVLRTQGFDNKEIADRLNITPQALKRLIKKASVEYGWNDVSEQLIGVAIPQAMSNLNKHLDHEGTPEAIANGVNTMTRETLRGAGVFKTHSAVKQETKKTVQILKVEITMPTLPPGDQGASQVEGVLATPRRALPDANPTSAATLPVIDAETVPVG